MNKSKVENGEVIEKEIERIILGYFTSFFDLGEAKSSYNSRTNEYHNNIPLERAVSEMKAFITNALNQQRRELISGIGYKLIDILTNGNYINGISAVDIENELEAKLEHGFLTKLEK